MRVVDDVAIRRAALVDVAAICDFGAAHIPAHYEPLLGKAAANKQVREWWNRAVIEGAVANRAILLAEARGQLIAVAQFSAHDQPPVIYKLYLHPHWRGQGLGPILLDAVLSSLPPQTSRVAIEHFAANTRAAQFYERQGFVVDRVSADPSGDPALAVVWRVKKLA